MNPKILNPELIRMKRIKWSNAEIDPLFNFEKEQAS